MTLSISISQAIVAVQLVLLLFTVVLSMLATGQRMARVAAIGGSLFAVAAVVVAVLALGNVVPIAATDTGSANTYLIYAILAVGIAIAQWVSTVVVAQLAAQRAQRRLTNPRAVTRAGDELRAILRQEGIDLDARLQHAEGEREQFLYALEERHAQQIAGLAQEYQHEARTILSGLLDELAAERLLPLVEERLAEHEQQIEAELGLLDAAAGGETLTSLRTDLTDLLAQVEAAEARVQAAKDASPDRAIEELLPERLAAVDAQIAERVAVVQAEMDEALAATTAGIELRIAEVGALLDEKIDTAGSPLAGRMAETEARVGERLAMYDATLDTRFADTEAVLNDRVAQQERALEERVIEVEHAIEARLATHVTGVEGVLAQHDEQLQSALMVQSDAVMEQLTLERDRIITELRERTGALQAEIQTELTTAEDRARETVEATQDAWNGFTEELEQRFAITRDEALKAAKEIALAERTELETGLAEAVRTASAEISERVEQLGREAAWQRAQVERTVEESLEALKQNAQDAVDNADSIFGDLERIGAERVEKIRRQAEDALVQSRDYVEQLQTSLSAHLDELRERSETLASGMNDRLASITSAGDVTAQQIQQLASDVVESVGRELNAASEQQLHSLSQRLSHDVAANVERGMHEQQRAFEAHLGELAQRIMQQSHGDLAGLAEHARTAVTGELERVMVQARDQAHAAQQQGYMQLMDELARQQGEMQERSREAITQTRSMLDDGLRDSRRQLEEAMASMGAHMREELVRFGDEGQRRVAQIVEQLQSREHDLLRDEDRRLTTARNELVKQHQGAMEQQVKSMVGGLSNVLGTGGAGSSAGGMSLSAQVSNVPRPSTPLSGQSPQQPGGAFGNPAGNGSSFGTNPFGI